MSLYVLDLPLGFQVAEKPKVKRCTSVSQIFNVSLLVSSPLETHAVEIKSYEQGHRALVFISSEKTNIFSPEHSNPPTNINFSRKM